MTDPGTARAWGWVAHLRDGGTIPWRDWSAGGEPAGRTVPGAQQLELLRRANAVARPRHELVEQLLTADPPRRFRPALPLLGGPPALPHGPPPVDPLDVGPEELVELAAVVLARRLATRPAPSPPRGVRRPWAIRYHLHGDPELVRTAARHLTARGRPPASHGGRVLVLGTDAGLMLADVWTHRALTEGVVPWSVWLRRLTGGDYLPGPADLEQAAEAGYGRPAVRGVHMVTDPSLAPRLVGVRRPLPVPPPLAAVAVELGRRVVAALRPLVTPDVRRALLSEVLRPQLATVAGPPLVVPAAHREWLAECTGRMITRLRRDPGRYPVHGALELLLPVDRPGTGTIRPGDTLAAGLELLLADADRTSVEEGP